MAYASVAELRERYAQDVNRDEFGHHTDEHLAQALRAASAEIDSWRRPGSLGPAAAAIVHDKCLALARMLAHQDHPLDAVHPIVRDGVAVRDWLRAVAAGRVLLEPEESSGVVSGHPVASSRKLIYTDTLWGSY